MAFSNLEQKYKQTVNKLYKGDRTKFENGKPSTGLNDDPLITRRRGDGYFGGASRAFGRALPITSSFQDLKRITLFTLSVRGITFLVKQQLLQTGNTFEQTRLINPVFAIGNTVPFLHLRRHLRPFNTLLKRTDTSYSNVRKLGQLQKSTYEGASTDNKKGLGGLIKKLTAPITSTISAVTAKKNVGEELSWEYSRPELGKKDNDYINSLFNPKASFKFGGVLNPSNDTFTFATNILYGSIARKAGAWDGTYTTYLSYMDGEKKWTFRQTGGTDYEYSAVTRPDRGLENIPDDDGEAFALEARSYNLSETAAENDLLTRYTSEDSVIQTQLFENQKKYLEAESAWLQEMTTSEEENIPFLKYFDSDTESITGQRTVNDDTGEVFSQNAKYFARNRNTDKRISYIKDPANEAVTSTRDILRPYRTINNEFDDAINVSIAMGNDQPLKFRAFIKDLQQSASPQYKDYQYIGRTEKFISYVTVQREISFKLGVLAFSKDELDTVWKRINYLTGLVYPYGVNRGILQPNIMRLTIGNMYVNQPGYLTSLSTNFTEMSESWDIDREVPIGAQMDMKFVLIEKKSRIASSPFYGITEQMSGSAGFAQSIQSR